MTDHPTSEHGPSEDARLSALGETIRWAVELDGDPALAGATWLTREIVPAARDPFEAIAAPATSLEALSELKNAFKLLRTSGRTAAERSLAARLYAATIAAALVRHRSRISSQSDPALVRAFADLFADDSMPERIRELASLAIGLVDDRR